MQRENSASAAEGLNSILKMAAQAETAPLAMPGGVYTSEGLLELELDTLFKHEWFCVGRADELPLAGTNKIDRRSLTLRAEANEAAKHWSP